MSRPVFSSVREMFQAVYPGACQRVAISASSTQSSAVAVSCHIIELFATKDCWVKLGANPTAAVNDGTSMFLGAGLFKYFGIQSGHKIAVIRDAADGYLHIIEGAN